MSDVSASVEAIDSLLPQTQCGKCGQAGCRPYAEAIVRGEADINQCPPGGEELLRELAALLNISYKPLNPAFGAHHPPAMAVIDETTCIGCTLCIQACPVDAIVGAAKYLHTVIADECTGCELCLPPCPVDCIVMQPRQIAPTAEGRRLAAAQARRRYEARTARLARERALRSARPEASSRTAAQERKRAAVQRAIARAQTRLQQRGR
ncbi:MAG: RnfABCDGE type electron transport complex subunit B [Betaproteobacteria bacterium]